MEVNIYIIILIIMVLISITYYLMVQQEKFKNTNIKYIKSNNP